MLKRLLVAITLCLGLVATLGIGVVLADANTIAPVFDGSFDESFVFAGVVESRSDDEIAISGMSFAVTEDTIFSIGVEVGSFVFVALDGDPTMGGTALMVFSFDDPAAFVYVAGEVTELADTSIVVDGVAFEMGEYTAVYGELEVGAMAYVDGVLTEDMTNIAFTISVEPTDPIDPVDPVEQVDAFGTVISVTDDEIVIEDIGMGLGEMTFTIISDTVVFGTVSEGSMVIVSGMVEDSGELVALFIQVLDDGGGSQHVYGDGIVTAVTSDTITVEVNDWGFISGTVTVQITNETVVWGEPEVGDYVFFEGFLDEESGDVIATYVEVDEGTDPIDFMVAVGSVVAVDEMSVTLLHDDGNGSVETTFLITPETFYFIPPMVGDEAVVEAFLNDEGNWVASYIEVFPGNPDNYFEYFGVVESISPTLLVVDGIEVVLTDATVFEGDVVPVEGDLVYLFGTTEEDANYASYVVVFVEDEYDDEYFDIEGVVEVVSDTFIVVDGMTITVSAETWIDGTLEVGAEVYVTGMVLDGEMIADYILVYSEEPGPGVEPYVEALGPVAAYTAGESLIVNGVTFGIDDFTVIEGTPEVGLNVYVFGIPSEDGLSLTALFIQVLDEFVMEGVIDDFSPNGITIDGITLDVTKDTHVQGEITVGMRVRVGMDAPATGRSVTAPDALLIQPASVVPTAVAMNSATTSVSTMTLMVATLLAAMMVATRTIWKRNA